MAPKNLNYLALQVILFRPFGFIALKTLNYLTFQSFDLSVPDDVYSRNVSCALN